VSKSTVSFRHISIFMRATIRSVIQILNSIQTYRMLIFFLVGGGGDFSSRTDLQNV